MPLDLQGEFLAVAATIEQRLAELPVGQDFVLLALVLDVITAGNRPGDDTVILVAVRVQAHHAPMVADDALVALQLAGHRSAAVGIGAIDVGGDGHQQGRIVVRHHRGVEALRILLGDEAGVEVAGLEARMLHQRRLERDVRRDAANDEAVQRVAHPGNRLFAGGAVHDQLGDHRVVEHRDLAAVVDAGIDPDLAWNFLRRLELDQTAGGRQEAAERVFGVDPAFHRPAVELNLLLGQRQLFAGGDADHQLDQVNAGDQFGDRMLDLQAGVHFQEVEALVGTDDELDRPGRFVLHGAGQGDGLLAHRLAHGRIDEGRRRLLDDLLVPALDRAVALVQVNIVAEGVAQHLDFDVARFEHVFFDKDAVVVESILGFIDAGGKALEGFLVVEGDAQTLAAAAGRGLDHHRITDALGDLDRLGRTGNRRVIAGNGIDLGFERQLLGLDLVAHLADRVVLRADELDAFFFQATRELGVLGQEAVARMDGLGAGLLAGGDDLVHDQVGLFRGGRADADGFVGQVDVQGVLVGLGIDGNGLDAHLAGGLDDAASDFAAVGDQNFSKHV